MKKSIIKQTYEITEPTGNEELVKLAKEKGIKLYGTKSTTISTSGKSESENADLLESFDEAEKSNVKLMH